MGWSSHALITKYIEHFWCQINAFLKWQFHSDMDWFIVLCDYIIMTSSGNFEFVISLYVSQTIAQIQQLYQLHNWHRDWRYVSNWIIKSHALKHCHILDWALATQHNTAAKQHPLGFFPATYKLDVINNNLLLGEAITLALAIQHPQQISYTFPSTFIIILLYVQTSHIFYHQVCWYSKQRE